MGLSERDRAILEFEGRWWTEPGPKDTAIKDRFGLSSSRTAGLAALIDSSEAESLAPLLVRRLRRDRDERRRARFEGKPAGGRRVR